MAGRFVVTAILMACLVGGCSDDGSTGRQSQSKASDSAGSPRDRDAAPLSDGREVPELPDAARADTLKGAKAFVGHYIELLNYAAKTGDTTELLSVSNDNCTGCSDYAEAYASTYEAGGYIRTSGWRPMSLDLIRQGPIVTVLTSVEAPQTVYVRKAGDPRRRGRGGTYRLRFEVAMHDGAWGVRIFSQQADA